MAPYINLMYLKAEDANPSRLRKFLVDSKKELSQEDLEIYGPFDSPVTKIGFKHRMFCIIQSSKKQKMLEVLSKFTKNTEKSKRKYQIGLLILILLMQFKNFLLFVCNSMDLF